ncbi:excisionase [Chromobacterium subtsugae]|uniref:excisionase n=1 Tax=Chromobacterium subtsugae TaxID=251747 RepID=UPI0009BB1EFE|nr:excisionase [Chromobacterium subtsugae]
MKIKLTEWASKQINPPPHRNTLTKWVSHGLIQPLPEFIGRAYYVEETAKFIGGRTTSPQRGKPRQTEAKQKKQRLIHRI